MTKRKRRVGKKASERPKAGVRCDGAVKRSASTEGLAVQVAFLRFWILVDISDEGHRDRAWGQVVARWPGGAHHKTCEMPKQFTEEWHQTVATLRKQGDVVALLAEILCCSDEAGPQKTTTWRPLPLPRGVVDAGGRRAGLERFNRVRRYLDDWAQAFVDTTLCFADTTGLGLKARHTIKIRDVVIAGFRDYEAPKNEISMDDGGISILGPFALANAGCARHAKVRFGFGVKTTKVWGTATAQIQKGGHILALYAEATNCALSNCSRPCEGELV
mmetsp:Transcript_4367/g.14473  ORF Transcript_4367/g.14473 Transcript_4367/m.14473 type:complete len:274 (+) Transcript_4367:79-900(+)